MKPSHDLNIVAAFACVAAVIATRPAAATDAALPETVIIGCLRSSAPDSYSITDRRSGTVTRIEADKSSPETTLAWQVGSELEVHGTRAAGEQARIKASRILRIAIRCRPDAGD